MRLLPERDCSNCPANQRVRWGCEADASFPMPFDGERISRCPRKPYLDSPEWFNSLFEAYSWREKGFLPQPGTWRDQDHRFVIACNIIDRAHSDASEEERYTQEAKRAQMDRAGKQGGKVGPGGSG
ncbi:hypothetical protein LCGC14_3103210, partial [marine sediment metagenome]